MAVPGKKVPSDFSSSISLGSEEDLKLFCLPCDREGPRLPAFGFCKDCNEHLCQSCYNHHKKATPSRHHVLLDIHTMPKTQQLSSPSDHVASHDDLTIPCLKHKKKMIEFYCQHHKVTLCSVCVTLEHTGQLCKVDYIPDIAEETVDSKEFKDITEHMDALLQHCQSVKEKCKKVTDKSNASITEALKEIRKHRQEINKRIDELESEVENKAKTLHQQNKERVQNTEAICDDVTKSVKELSNNIKQSNIAKQADKLFIELKTAQLEITEHETCIKELITAEDVKEYQFTSNQTILTVLQKETSLGTLEDKILATKVKKALDEYVQIPLGQPVLEAETETKTKSSPASKTNEDYSQNGRIHVQTQSDKKICEITGMTVLNSDELAVADNSNKCIKMISVSSQTVTSQMSLSQPPWGITKVTNNKVVVTQPYGNRIQFISVNSKMLSQEHSLKIGGKGRGICFYKDKLVVSYDSPAKVEILDMKGTVLTTVTHNTKGGRLFKNPYYVQVNNHSIYVSDWGNTTITRLNWKGMETGSFTEFGQNKGIALSSEDTLFVCDFTRYKVFELSDDCTKRKIVTKSVKLPYALCWCNEAQTLYVSSNSSSEMGNFIYILHK
ncbi:E3 ubiquitin-protein ligase TRIM71-like [Mercenaria mercenaria]|uniref:E3 ubiquitin-protein ligase TRIM71-like n=1 Tax=Mercenaria mercenaria TaxID=6596 RepID=UPI00234F7ABE|nr:E3 ubiquitin-protein ligase TRIM71-like [Mercenaria mercenaria]